RAPGNGVASPRCGLAGTRGHGHFPPTSRHLRSVVESRRFHRIRGRVCRSTEGDPRTADMEYEYIDRPDQLARVVQRMAAEPLLGVDTEAAGYHRYLDRISLLQVSSRTENFLIDPLAIEDLSPLAPLLAARSIEQVFHDADYDLRILHRDLAMQVAGLFDTQIAAAFLGEKSLGLGALVERFLGPSLPKAFQRADWAERP